MKKIFQALLLLALLSAPALATPTVVQSISGPGSRGSASVTAYVVRFPAITLSGNTIAVASQGSGGATSVTDDASNTYAQAGSTCTDGNQPITWYVAKNASPARVVTVHWSVAKTFLTVAAAELYNVDQTTAVDTVSAGANPTCNHAASGTAITAGTATPTTTGAIALNYVIQDSVISPINKWTNGAACNGFTTLTADTPDSTFLQSAITSGACNADATQDTSHAWSSSTLFLRPAIAGTAPSNSIIRVVRDQHMNFGHSPCDATPHVIEWGGTQSLWVLRWVGSPNETLGVANGASANPTDDNGNTWTEIGSPQGSGTGSGVAQVWKCVNCTSSNTNRITLPFTGSCAIGSTVHLLDVTGYDNTVAPVESVGTGNMTSGTPSHATISITPGANRPGMIVFTEGHATNDDTAVNAPAGNFMSFIITTTPATSPVDENNGNSIAYPSDNTAVSVTWTVTGNVGVWAEKDVWFAGPAPVGGSPKARTMTLGIGRLVFPYPLCNSIINDRFSSCYFEPHPQAILGESDKPKWKQQSQMFKPQPMDYRILISLNER